MTKGSSGLIKLEWLPTMLAAIAFVGFLVAFCCEIFAYQNKVVEWAERDLQSRADLAASNLDEPLKTQDFRKIHEFGAKCESDGYRLTVLHGQGRVFDSHRSAAYEPQCHAEQTCGEYVVRLWIPRREVMKPFRRAFIGASLAVFVGIAGVLLFFFVTYRQRVRIRELKRLEEFRRGFIADVSHEIKTPLTGILGAVDMMDATDGQSCSPDQMRLLTGLVRKEAKRLNALVQSILDLARLEREDDAVKRVETNLMELLRETVDGLIPAATAAGIKLRFASGDGASDGLLANVDPQLIGEAVSNLIVNAIRYSKSDEVIVLAERLGSAVNVSVTDYGIGIPSEESERVFERFHRLDPARAAETGGAGLGLAIVRRIARLHGGDVTLKPSKPHGCTFNLTIPV